MTAPTTPEERRAATAAWRAVPYPVRRQVVSAARRGIPGPDAAAVAAGRYYAETMLRPRGVHWWQRFRQRMWFRLTLIAFLVAETVWLVGIEEAPWTSAWPAAVAAYLILLMTLLHVSVRRGLRRLVALPAGSADVSAAPPSSAPREPGASTPP